MKVVGGCSLDTKVIMKDFYFDDGTAEDVIQDVVDQWAENLLHSWYVICQTKENEEEE